MHYFGFFFFLVCFLGGYLGLDFFFLNWIIITIIWLVGSLRGLFLGVQPPESPLLLSSSTHSQKKRTKERKETQTDNRSVKRKGSTGGGEQRRGKGVITLILTAVGRVGGWAVEESRRARDTQVGHASVSVAVHAVADGVVVGLLWSAAGHVAARRHAARVTAVTNCRKNKSTIEERKNEQGCDFISRMHLDAISCPPGPGETLLQEALKHFMDMHFLNNLYVCVCFCFCIQGLILYMFCTWISSCTLIRNVSQGDVWKGSGISRDPR